MKLTDTQAVILSKAAQHPDGIAAPPANLPPAPRGAVAKALTKAGLLAPAETTERQHPGLAWKLDSKAVFLRITDAGLRAIGIEPETAATGADTARQGGDGAAQGDAPVEGDKAAQGAPPAPEEDSHAQDLALLDAALAAPTPAPASLREAAAAVLAAWDDETNREADMITALDGPMQALRVALAAKSARATREPGVARTPREGTKREAVLAMLRRPEGATVAQIAEATGWAPHTVRGFFAGLKKRQGIEVQVLERVRQAGFNKEGAKGSYTIYGIAN